MTSYDYDAAKIIASESINKYGGAANLVTKGVAGGYDSSGNVTADTPDVTLSGISTPLGIYSVKEIDGTSIMNGDSFVCFQSDSAPSIGMQITITGKTLRVINVTSVASISNIVLYYKLQLRD